MKDLNPVTEAMKKKWARTEIATHTKKVVGGAKDAELCQQPGYSIGEDRFVTEWQRWKDGDGNVIEVLQGQPEVEYVLTRLGNDRYVLAGTRPAAMLPKQ